MTPPGGGRVRFVMSPTFEREILAAPATREWVQGMTEEVARDARENAPFRTGALESDIEAIVEFDGAHGTYVGRVVSRDFKSVWNEFGTKKMAARPFLRPALQRVVPGARISSR